MNTPEVSPPCLTTCGPMLGVIMAGHASQLLSVLSQGNGGGLGTKAWQCWVCYFVDSSQWISVDSWASQCPGTKPRLTIHGLPRVTWFVDSKANICLWIITLNESLSITAEKTWNSKQHAKCLQFWTHPALRPRAMSLLFWGFLSDMFEKNVLLRWKHIKT